MYPSMSSKHVTGVQLVAQSSLTSHKYKLLYDRMVQDQHKTAYR